MDAKLSAIALAAYRIINQAKPYDLQGDVYRHLAAGVRSNNAFYATLTSQEIGDLLVTLDIYKSEYHAPVVGGSFRTDSWVINNDGITLFDLPLALVPHLSSLCGSTLGEANIITTKPWSGLRFTQVNRDGNWTNITVPENNEPRAHLKDNTLYVYNEGAA